MKKFLALTVCALASLSLFAQRDVTKFLGIPVDGSKSEMISALKNKGFSSTYGGEFDLIGEFNGQSVQLAIVTNGNKVYRVCLQDQVGQSEGDIKIRFNRLCRQFLNNDKYEAFNKNCELSESEDISYEMTVHNKRFEAAFYQKPDANKLVWFMISQQMGRYYILMFYDNCYNESNGEDL